jgi:polyketide synthase PksL
MLSTDGRAAVFDESATGMVPGEAVAVVLLKPLSKAIRDGDHIHGCIRAHGVNYDGKTNGITAPDPNSQAELLASTYKTYGVDPGHIDLVLAHSVGSRLGDPVEIEAFTKAFGRFTARKEFCHLGSIKPLLGHTFAASGIVNLIAMVLAMKHHTLLGANALGQVNSYIHFEKSPFVVGSSNEPWEAREGRPRLGALGATGISGANAHVVVEEYSAPAAKAQYVSVNTVPGTTYCVPLSARTLPSLIRVAEAFEKFLKEDRGVSLSDLAYTLQIGRDAMAVRAAFVVGSKEMLLEQLGEFVAARGEGIARTTVGSPQKADGQARASSVEQLAADWLSGREVDWHSPNTGTTHGKLVSLPTYSFEQKRYWVKWEQRKPAIEPTSVPAPRGETPRPPSSLPEPPAAKPRVPTALEPVRPAVEVPRVLAREVDEHQHLSQLKAQIRNVIEKVFLMDEAIDDARPLFEIGMTSMNTAQVVAALNEQFGTNLMASDIFDYPTVERLADYFAKASPAGVRPVVVEAKSVERDTMVRTAKAPTWTPPVAALEPCNRLDAILQGIVDDEMAIEDALDCLNPEQ